MTKENCKEFEASGKNFHLLKKKKINLEGHFQDNMGKWNIWENFHLFKKNHLVWKDFSKRIWENVISAPPEKELPL